MTPRLVGVLSQYLPPPDDPAGDDLVRTWDGARCRIVHARRARALRRRGEEVIDTGMRTRTGKFVFAWFVEARS